MQLLVSLVLDKCHSSSLRLRFLNALVSLLHFPEGIRRLTVSTAFPPNGTVSREESVEVDIAGREEYTCYQHLVHMMLQPMPKVLSHVTKYALNLVQANESVRKFHAASNIAFTLSSSSVKDCNWDTI